MLYPESALPTDYIQWKIPLLVEHHFASVLVTQVLDSRGFNAPETQRCLNGCFFSRTFRTNNNLGVMDEVKLP